MEVCARMTSGHFQRHPLFKCFHTPSFTGTKNHKGTKGAAKPKPSVTSAPPAPHQLLTQLQTALLAIILQWSKSWACPFGKHQCDTGHKPHQFHHRLQILTLHQHKPSQLWPQLLQTWAELHSQPWESSWSSQNLWLGHQHMSRVTQASLQPGQGHQTELDNGRKTNNVGVNLVRLRQLQAWVWTELSTRAGFFWEEELGELLPGFCWGRRRSPSWEVYEVILTFRTPSAGTKPWAVLSEKDS